MKKVLLFIVFVLSLTAMLGTTTLSAKAEEIDENLRYRKITENYDMRYNYFKTDTWNMVEGVPESKFTFNSDYLHGSWGFRCSFSKFSTSQNMYKSVKLYTYLMTGDRASDESSVRFNTNVVNAQVEARYTIILPRPNTIAHAFTLYDNFTTSSYTHDFFRNGDGYGNVY